MEDVKKGRYSCLFRKSLQSFMHFIFRTEKTGCFRTFVKCFKVTGNRDKTVFKSTKCVSQESKSAEQCKGRLPIPTLMTGTVFMLWQ